jgi:hypothetical protein
MILQGIAGYNSLEQRVRQQEAAAPGKKAIAASPPQDPNRSEFLKLVQEKIKKGFYNSDIVAEDLSHSFAGAFDKIV